MTNIVNRFWADSSSWNDDNQWVETYGLPGPVWDDEAVWNDDLNWSDGPTIFGTIAGTSTVQGVGEGIVKTIRIETATGLAEGTSGAIGDGSWSLPPVDLSYIPPPPPFIDAKFLGLALHDKTHDIFAVDGHLAMVVDNRAIAEHVKQRLLFYRNEWFLDTSAGTPWFQNVFVRPHNDLVIESVIKREILDTPGVAELVGFELQIDQRKREINVLEAKALSTLDEDLEIIL